MAPRVLRKLRIDDVSSVDVGAGRGVRVLLTKRNTTGTHSDGVPTLYAKPLVFSKSLSADADAYLKRKIADTARSELVTKGLALPDGSFPIESAADLKHAIETIGRARDPAQAKAFIKSRATALGADDAIPQSWSKSVSEVVATIRQQIAKGAVEFDQAYAMIEAAEDAHGLMHEVREALCALECSIQSILSDEDVTDKAAKIAETYLQFTQHLDGLPAADDDELEKLMTTGATTISPAVQKIIDDAVLAAVGKVDTTAKETIAKLERELVIAKMSEKHKAFHSNLGDDEKKKFEAMSPADRDSHMEKSLARSADDPVVKGLVTENGDLKKRLAALEDTNALALAKSDAKDMGLNEVDAGEVLMKARRGDAAALAKLESYTKTAIKSAAAIAKSGKVFEEFGKTNQNSGAGGATAYDELMAKATELKGKDPALTIEQAYAKVSTDPANKELTVRESNERINKISRAA